jgi:hypothetical protein
MAMTDDGWFPRLTPPDDRFPGAEGLLRKPEELTDEQFDLLAAARAESAIEASSLSDMEAAIAANPSRLQRAESFRNIKLTPYDDRWAGRNQLLRQSPATLVLRRYLIPTLLSAAAVAAIIFLWPSTARQPAGTPPGTLPEVAVLSEALIAAPSPVIIPAAAEAATDGNIADLNRKMPVSLPATDNTSAKSTVSVIETTDAKIPLHSIESSGVTNSGHVIEPYEAASSVQVIATAEASVPVRVTDAHTAEPVLLIADANNTSLNPVEVKNVIAAPEQAPSSKEIPATEKMAAPVQASSSKEIPATDKESSWVIRGISALAKAITKEEKSIDGYVIASTCVNGISNVLGLEMELQQTSNDNGEPVAVKFNSSLISVSAPVNKNSQ